MGRGRRALDHPSGDRRLELGDDVGGWPRPRTDYRRAGQQVVRLTAVEIGEGLARALAERLLAPMSR